MSGALEERNKQVVREFYRIKNERDYDALDAIMVDGFGARFVRHFGELEEFDVGYLKERYRLYWEAFPDLYYDVHELVAEGDWVVARLHYRGTHLGKLRDLEPTGKQIDVHQHLSFRFEDGKIAEMHSTADFLGGLWRRIGVAPPLE